MVLAMKPRPDPRPAPAGSFAPAERRPSGAFTNDSFDVDAAWTYSEEEWLIIAETLTVSRTQTEAQLCAARAAITEAARIYKGRSKSEKVRPTAGAVRGKIVKLDRALGTANGAIGSLSQAAQNALNDWGLQIDNQPVMPALSEAL